MKHVLLGIAAALAAAALVPATAGAATVRGVVVERSAHHTLLVATRTGRVVAVKGRAAIGSRVVGRQVVGRTTHARIHGVVVKTKGSTIFLASNRHMVAIHSGRAPAAAGSAAATPTPGTIVTADVTITSTGRLDDQGEQDDGTDSSSTVTVTATVDAVGTGTVTVNVNGSDVTVDLPDGLTLPQSLVGQTVTFTISIGNGDDQGDNQGDNRDGGDGGSGH